MIKILLIGIVMCISSTVYSNSTGKGPKEELTQEQKKELAKQVGVILPGMTKQEVVKTLGEPRKIGYSASTGQEVWYYKSPEEQNIYFKDDKVERVEYLPKKRQIEPQPVTKEPEEIQKNY